MAVTYFTQECSGQSTFRDFELRHFKRLRDMAGPYARLKLSELAPALFVAVLMFASLFF